LSLTGSEWAIALARAVSARSLTDAAVPTSGKKEGDAAGHMGPDLGPQRFELFAEQRPHDHRLENQIHEELRGRRKPVPDEIWVTANFKETQLDAMRPRQPVTLAIDAYPDRSIYGHVASVQPGSGTAFSLLPAQNATGNYVKIVQRVPVKIVIDAPPADVALGPGMSVVPTVRIDPTPSLYERLRAWL
jgi:HlyD family secretion protein